MEVLVLNRGEIADSCGPKDSQKIHICFSVRLYLWENKYVTALTSEKKHWLNTVEEKQKISPSLWRKSSLQFIAPLQLHLPASML